MIIFRGFRGIKTEHKKIRSDSNKEVSLQFIPIFQDTPSQHMITYHVSIDSVL